MKKYIAFLLCIIIVFSLFSCNSQNINDQLPPDNNGENNNDISTDTDDGKNDNNGSSDTDFGQIIDSTDYYKIKEIGLGKHEYHIYDRWGKEVLVEVTNRPLRISIIDKLMIEIRIGMGTGTSVSKYYDIMNDRFSEKYLDVAAVSGNLVAYVDTSESHPINNCKLVVRDIFDKNGFFKSFDLDLDTAPMPIISAKFTTRQMTLELDYYPKGQSSSKSVTLPVRISTLDPNLYSEADRAILAYEELLNSEDSYLKDYSSPYSMIPLQGCGRLEYAYTDIDKDSVNELIIDCGDTIILRYYEGTVHLYPFTFRNLYYLQTDGSHSWNHTGSDFEYGEKQIYFDGADIKERELWRIVNDGEPDARYYVGGREVSLKELQKYLEENPKSPITRSSLVVPWLNKISRYEAINIAEEYWKDFNIKENGYNVEHEYNSWAPDSVYVLVIRRYVIDHYSTLDEIWIDKNTGETIIPHIFDGGKG